MMLWLVFAAVLALWWLAMWKNYTKMAVGVLIGLPIGWFASGAVHSYLTGNVLDVPQWLPPLPLAIVATLLLVVGLVIWFRPDPPDAQNTEHSGDSH